MMRFFRRLPPATLGERTRRRVTLHLIPWLFFLYILAFLDRANVSVAKLGMERSPAEGGLGFDAAVIGFGTGVFFWGYWILEIPSTISVLTWGARWVFVRILVLWGLACTLIGFIGTDLTVSMFGWIPDIPPDGTVLATLDGILDAVLGWTVRLGDPGARIAWLGALARFVNELDSNARYQFYFFRFLLGFFEGGFFPSVIVYLSLWFRPEDRARAIASFMSAIPLSLIVGSPLSGLMLEIRWLDMAGWRWVFILQGIAPVLAGFATFFLLPDRPEKAAWLPPDERDWLLAELGREHQGKKGRAGGHFPWLGHVWLVLLLTAAYFSMTVIAYGLTTFLPSILKEKTGLSSLWASVLAALPYLLAFLAMLANGWHSDRTRERIAHVAVPLLALSAALFLTGFFYEGPLWLVLLLLLLVGLLTFAHLPAYWPIPSTFLGPLAFASAAGFINMIGNLGGSVGPWLMGASRTGQGTYASALLRLAPFPLASALVVLFVGRLWHGRRPAPALAKDEKKV